MESPDCGAVQDDLPLWVNGRLPDPARQCIAAHLAGCPGCVRELAVLLRAAGAARAAAEALPPAPAAVLERVLWAVALRHGDLADPLRWLVALLQTAGLRLPALGLLRPRLRVLGQSLTLVPGAPT